MKEPTTYEEVLKALRSAESAADEAQSAADYAADDARRARRLLEKMVAPPEPVDTSDAVRDRITSARDRAFMAMSADATAAQPAILRDLVGELDSALYDLEPAPAADVRRAA